ncbi:class I SAM-dependent methyltransferase [Blastococcus deserti]|uniref:Class I SAM-dependent methyltransferase n=1 Tax=Blastococcus deserti TaxID=2259033 RepID=A0ABW4X4Q2_9ACTN
MFSAESLGSLLLALATGFPDRAKNMVQTSDELTEEERGLLWAPLACTDDPAKQARGLGDAIRKGGTNDFSANECYRAAFYLGHGVDELRDDPLFGYFSSHRAGRVLDKWVHYFPIYSRHLAPYRGRPIRVLEIGTYRGGSLDMWRWYFGPQVTLVGIDIDEDAKAAADPRHVVEIGDQTDADFLRRVAEEHGPFDVIIDDGGHGMQQQIVTAETLFPLLADGGVFLVEDCHTSYWDSYEGGRNRPGTFMEWAKQRLDDVNGFHQPGPVDPVWTGQLDGLHCYDSVVVLDKKTRFAPFAEQVGHAEFLTYPRAAAGMFSELLATRDAARAERDRLRRTLEEKEGARDEELRLLRAELASLRPKNAQLDSRLTQLKDELDNARISLRRVRRNQATGRWLRRSGDL